MPSGLANEVSLVSTNGSFGALLRAQRHRNHLSQEELAQYSGLSGRTIRNLEADRVRMPRASTARLLAEALGLAGIAREVFVQACRGTLDPVEHAEFVAALYSGQVRPRGGVPAELQFDDRGYSPTLDPLSNTDAYDMMERLLGTERVAAEPEAVWEIIGRCLRLPITLAYVSGRAAVHPEISLSVLAQELRSDWDGLDALKVAPLRNQETRLEQGAGHEGLGHWRYWLLGFAHRCGDGACRA